MTDGRKGPKRNALTAIAALVCCVFNSANAANFEWTPLLSVGLTYSDNIRLVPDQFAQEDWVAQLNPGIGVTGGAGILEVDAYYRAQALFYDENDDDNDVFHQFSGVGTLELIPEDFFLEAGGSFAQSTINPEQQFIFSNTSITQNRTDVSEVWVAPYYQYRLFSGEGSARYERRLERLDATALQDADRDLFDANWLSDSTAVGAGMTLGLNYTFDRFDYEQSDTVEFQEAQAQIGYWLNSGLRVFTIQGIEDDYLLPTDGSLSEYFWYVGADWNPSSRSRLEVGGGDRSYGSSFFARLAYDMRRGSISISYTDGAATTARSRVYRSGISEATAQQTIEDDFGRGLDESLDRPGEDSVFVRENLDGVLTLQTDKTDLRFRVYLSRREDQISLTGDSVRGDERAVGADIDWTWRVGVNTSLNTTFEYLDREFGDGSEDNLYRVTFGVEYNLGSRTSIFASVGRYEQESKTTPLSDVDENRVNIFVRRALFGSTLD